jgi:hypothetical protein
MSGLLMGQAQGWLPLHHPRRRRGEIEKQDNSKIHEKKYLGLEEDRNSHT